MQECHSIMHMHMIMIILLPLVLLAWPCISLAAPTSTGTTAAHRRRQKNVNTIADRRRTRSSPVFAPLRPSRSSVVPSLSQRQLVDLSAMSLEDDIRGLDNGMKNMPGMAEPEGTIVRLGTLSTVLHCTAVQSTLLS